MLYCIRALAVRACFLCEYSYIFREIVIWDDPMHKAKLECLKLGVPDSEVWYPVVFWPVLVLVVFQNWKDFTPFDLWRDSWGLCTNDGRLHLLGSLSHNIHSRGVFGSNGRGERWVLCGSTQELPFPFAWDGWSYLPYLNEGAADSIFGV